MANFNPVPTKVTVKWKDTSVSCERCTQVLPSQSVSLCNWAISMLSGYGMCTQNVSIKLNSINKAIRDKENNYLMLESNIPDEPLLIGNFAVS